MVKREREEKMEGYHYRTTRMFEGGTERRENGKV